MPRPCKRRRICALPRCGHFSPGTVHAKERDPIVMTLDEYETIRLIDFEGLTQAECSEQMNVARTTVQAIYNNARMKLAQCLVKERELLIQGGDYVLCERDRRACNRDCRSCHQHASKKEE